MKKKVIAIIKDTQDECTLFEGNCLGAADQEGCSKFDVFFGNNFRPREHEIQELYYIVLK
ncbi:hypothetical protein ACV3R5_14900 [Clostridium perfringens]|uniref:hypothetical protein n=1 Tax=Clostridium perfringens TaxID=1502 RepID=UPI001D7AAEFB|nr:hypothetical protein [Clostridium perfringens]EHR0219427.1 hypothetical protein [Clostridium perfringens]